MANSHDSTQVATTVFLVFGIGNFWGLLAGGFGGSYLYRWDRRYPSILAGVCAILSCPPLWTLLNAVDQDTSTSKVGVIAVIAGFFSGATGPIVKATLQNVCLPSSRGQAFALLNTFDDFGRGLGPVFVAMLVRNMGGRTPAFNAGVVGWLFCGVFNLLVFYTVSRDESRMQSQLARCVASSSTAIETLDKIVH